MGCNSTKPREAGPDSGKQHLQKAAVHVFVLTGGPSGGKTTAITKVADRLRSLNYQVYIVPEIATFMHSSGIRYPGGPDQTALRMVWEATRIRMQIAVEDNYRALCEASKLPSIIICDRGCTDTRAYMTDEEFQTLLKENNWTAERLRDGRYDAVCHLVSAADGAEKFYTTANNEARRESVDEARALDKKTREAWVGHTNLRVVGNAGDFSIKIDRSVEFFLSFLGLPSPTTRRKFVVKLVRDELKGESAEGWPVPFQDSILVSTFLQSLPEEEIAVRKRVQGNQTFYSISEMRVQDGQNVIRQRSIDERLYETMLQQRDPKLVPVSRRRRFFIWERHYFELDEAHPKDDRAPLVLTVEAAKDEEVPMPPWLKVEREASPNMLRLLAANQWHKA